MKKIITVNGKDIIIEKYQGNWYCRIGDTLIIKPTILEVKNDILTLNL